MSKDDPSGNKLKPASTKMMEEMLALGQRLSRGDVRTMKAEGHLHLLRLPTGEYALVINYAVAGELVAREWAIVFGPSQLLGLRRSLQAMNLEDADRRLPHGKQ